MKAMTAMRFLIRDSELVFIVVGERQRARNPITAGARVDHRVNSVTKENHVNKAADRGCLLCLVLFALAFYTVHSDERS